MKVAEFVSRILSSQRFQNEICDHRVLPARETRFGEPKRPWPNALRNLLEQRSLTLYSHQAEATNAIRAGKSVVVGTPTASGKSLIYTLPVLEQCLLDPDSHALYIFPLKALAQDQLQSFSEFVKPWPMSARPTIALYDGDTNESERKRIRRNPPSILITNPEMLHLAILPWHTQWTEFLAGLRLIVIDEAHTYRGVFGSHMAYVFRRLHRIVQRYGHEPSYVLSTATLGNPLELAVNLIGSPQNSPPVLIDSSGAPQGKRHFFFINPNVAAASTTAIELLRLALESDLRTIVYCRSRRMTELISMWAGSTDGYRYKNVISAYRAGFLPEERREIEAKMSKGELKCVVSTSALELGIDIGGLDVCILVGYPGTVMATLQRGGRVGRAQQESCVIIITGDDALDQYFANNPDDFFSRPPEKAVLNPNNEIICARHLECAAAELPLQVNESFIQSECCQKAIHSLMNEGKLLYSHDQSELFASRKLPQRDISLRGVGRECHIEDENGTIIGSVDLFRASREAHEGAVYLHRGKSYVIQKSNRNEARIIAKAEKVNWFTRVRAQKNTDILEEYERQSLGRCLCIRGRLRITDQVTAYEKRSTHGNRLLNILPLHEPPIIFETEGLWYVFPDSIRLFIENQYLHFMGSIHALEHAMIGLLPLQILADRNDFGGISTPLHPQIGLSCVFIYDGVPYGAGLTRAAFPNAKDLLQATHKAIAGCKCTDGCPSCVHSPKCGSGNRPISKEGALFLLNALLGDGNEGDLLKDTLHIEPCKENPTHSPTPQPLHAQDFPPPSFMPKAAPKRFIVFDVETRRSSAEVGGWKKADLMGVSIVVAYDSKSEKYMRFEQHELAALFELFSQSDLIVGFNSLSFDYLVLKPFTEMDLWKLPSLDILHVVKKCLKYPISLQNIASTTLGMPKSANGIQALKWWKENRLDLIGEYCQKDVEITKELYLFGLTKGYLLFQNKAGQKVQIPVDF